MKLITETSFESNIINEDINGKKSLFIEGPFMVSDLVNKNNRVYPSSVLDPEVERYINEEIKENRSYGECNHPSSPTVSLDRVSHIIKSLRKEGNNWIGKAKLLDTPCGKIIMELINEGCKVGVSSRALGDVKRREDGINEVCGNFKLTAVDCVSSPSAVGAFVNGIMENVEFWFDENKGMFVQEYVEKTKKQLKKLTTKQIEEAKFKLFEQYINILVNK